MVTVLLRRNLAGLLHSTGAKKPNETNKTVVLLQICVEKLQRLLTAVFCCVFNKITNFFYDNFIFTRISVN